MTFKGFSSGKIELSSVPSAFFSELMPHINHLGELKLILYFFWRLERMSGSFRGLRRVEIASDELMMTALTTALKPDLATDPGAAQAALDEALQLAVRDGALLQAELPAPQSGEVIYFVNSPRGRAAVQAIQNGQWQPGSTEAPSTELAPPPPNIFRLYEEHIGPLTPMISEALGEAEDTYPPAWIEQAFRIAVENNKRNWRYIEAILKRWKEEGRHEQEDRRDPEKARRKYLEGEYSDFIKS